MNIGDRVAVKNCPYVAKGVSDGSQGIIINIRESTWGYVEVELDCFDGYPMGTYLYHKHELEVIK